MPWHDDRDLGARDRHGRAKPTDPALFTTALKRVRWQAARFPDDPETVALLRRVRELQSQGMSEGEAAFEAEWEQEDAVDREQEEDQW